MDLHNFHIIFTYEIGIHGNLWIIIYAVIFPNRCMSIVKRLIKLRLLFPYSLISLFPKLGMVYSGIQNCCRYIASVAYAPLHLAQFGYFSSNLLVLRIALVFLCFLRSPSGKTNQSAHLQRLGVLLKFRK